MNHPNHPSLLRRLAAMGYDTLLVFGALLVAALPLPLIPEAVQASWWGLILIRTYLGLVCFAFFGWFWVHGGQTLGMRAWRLRLVGSHRNDISWGTAARRFIYALVSWLALGLGYIWILFDRRNLAWHDHWSGTRVVLLPKEPASKHPAQHHQTENGK